MGDNKNDYETHSFILLGKTGVGKSSLCNNICKENKFEVSDSFESCTTETSSQTIINDEKKYKLLIIDTPGFDDTEGRDDKNIETMKNYIKENERIKGIIIVIDFTNVRFDRSLQNSIKIIADLFPLTNFWEHVIIVWSHYDSKNIAKKQNIEGNNFISTKSLQNLFNDLEKNNKITKPSSLQMKFIDSNPNLSEEELKKSHESAEELVEDIIKMKPMYKEIRDGEEEDVEDDSIQQVQQGNDTVIYYKKRKKRIFIDFDDKQTEKEYIIEKYSMTKKEEESEKETTSLSSEEQDRRNKIIQEEQSKYEDDESYKRTKRENIIKYVQYKIYKYYKNGSNSPDESKTETTTDIKQEWTEEDVTETESISHGINEYEYFVYKYKEKRTNKYNNYERIDKKLIDQYYEKKEKTTEILGSWKPDGSGVKYKVIKEYLKDRYNRIKGDPSIQTFQIERKVDIVINYNSFDNDGTYEYTEILWEKDEEKDRQFNKIKETKQKGNGKWEDDYNPDIFDYRDDGYDGEYTEYYHDEKRKVLKIGNSVVKTTNWEKDRDYEKRAKYERKDGSYQQKDINRTDVLETYKRRIKIFNTKKRVYELPYGNWENYENTIYNYYKIEPEDKEEIKPYYEDSGEKDKDNKVIKLKHYKVIKWRREIRKRNNNEIDKSEWKVYDEKIIRNTKYEMIYRREATGAYKYKWFAWAKWDHEYEYRFYKQLKRYYSDGNIEHDGEIYRGAWYI